GAARVRSSHFSLAEPLPLAILERLCDRDAMAEAENAGLAVRDGADARLAPPLHAEVIRSTLDEAERRAIMAALAAAFSEAGSLTRNDVLRVASWRLESG